MTPEMTSATLRVDLAARAHVRRAYERGGFDACMAWLRELDARAQPLIDAGDVEGMVAFAVELEALPRGLDDASFEASGNADGNYHHEGGRRGRPFDDDDLESPYDEILTPGFPDKLERECSDSTCCEAFDEPTGSRPRGVRTTFDDSGQCTCPAMVG